MKALLVFWALTLPASAQARARASGQLAAAAAAPVLETPEAAAETGRSWPDGAEKPLIPAVAGSESKPSALAPFKHGAHVEGPVMPPSPSEAAAGKKGFGRGFIMGFTGVEWVPNWLAAKVPVVGKLLGFVLGLALLPVALLAGAVGGLVTLIGGLF